MIAIGSNIITPLGDNLTTNIQQMLSDCSSVKIYDNKWNLPPFAASMFPENYIEDLFASYADSASYTQFEQLAVLSVAKAIEESKIPVDSRQVVFVVSTTKGNVHLLENNPQSEDLYLWRSAEKIARFFGNTNPVMVVSNACISGLAAQVYAHRLLQQGKYKYVVVVGVDILSKFIVSGFQSLKAISNDFCQPFDKDRKGLNLGEAAATVVYTLEAEHGIFNYCSGAIVNDANHISAPSRTAEGLYKAVKKMNMSVAPQELGFINAHGTATLYNDMMESYCIDRLQMNAVPTNSFKGYIGHTLGAAGLVETLLSVQSLKEGRVVATKGFKQQGEEKIINIVHNHLSTDKKYFLKLISGFGGTNAAGLFSIP